MSNNPSVILSGVAYEAANQKTAVQQFAAFAAMGLQYHTNKKKIIDDEREKANPSADE